ncbi:MAG: hypothetical protein RLZZ546_125 [Bacteroidota bacterium]|jgi:endonuclease/exonuclease/phosphatase family metal-dependent hydrolase
MPLCKKSFIFFLLIYGNQVYNIDLVLGQDKFKQETKDCKKKAKVKQTSKQKTEREINIEEMEVIVLGDMNLYPETPYFEKFSEHIETTSISLFNTHTSKNSGQKENESKNTEKKAVLQQGSSYMAWRKRKRR